MTQNKSFCVSHPYRFRMLNDGKLQVSKYRKTKNGYKMIKMWIVTLGDSVI